MRWMNTALSAMLLTVLMVGSPAHAQNRNRNQPDPPPPKPDTAMTAVAPAPPAGGLWSEVRARQLMGIDGSARQVGDKITVRILERSYTSLDANTNTSRNSSSEASITSLFGAEKTLAKANPNLDGGVSLGVSSGAAYDGGGSTTRGSALEDILTCEVVEVLPNGDLRIWGQKEIKVNRETQWLTVTGVVRPRDVQMDNTIESVLLAESQIHVSGTGVVADRGSGPGWGARLIDFLWPF